MTGKIHKGVEGFTGKPRGEPPRSASLKGKFNGQIDYRSTHDNAQKGGKNAAFKEKLEVFVFNGGVPHAGCEKGCVPDFGWKSSFKAVDAVANHVVVERNAPVNVEMAVIRDQPAPDAHNHDCSKQESIRGCHGSLCPPAALFGPAQDEGQRIKAECQKGAFRMADGQHGHLKGKEGKGDRLDPDPVRNFLLKVGGPPSEIVEERERYVDECLTVIAVDKRAKGVPSPGGFPYPENRFSGFIVVLDHGDSHNEQPHHTDDPAQKSEPPPALFRQPFQEQDEAEGGR